MAIKPDLSRGGFGRILWAGKGFSVRSKRARVLLLGALLLVLVPGPTLALCTPDAAGDCCCHRGKCPKPGARKAMSCCDSQDSAPPPAEKIAQTSSTSQTAPVMVESEFTMDAADDASPAAVGADATEAPQSSLSLFTLHAVFLI